MKRLLVCATALAAAPALAQPIEGAMTTAEVLESATPDDWRSVAQENALYVELEQGTVVIELSSVMAPAHVAQIKGLAREGFYDGLSFYRVIDGFVAQGGDFLDRKEFENGAAALTAEFDQPLTGDIPFTAIPDADNYAATVGFVETMPAGTDGGRVWLLHCAGALAFARDVAPDTADTEIYITLQPQRYLDRNLSVVGKVVHGMEHLQALRRVPAAIEEGDDPGDPILSMRVGADLPEDEQLPLEVLRSDAAVFQDYVAARRNRAEGFFVYRPNYVDICQLPYPVRMAPDAGE